MKETLIHEALVAPGVSYEPFPAASYPGSLLRFEWARVNNGSLAGATKLSVWLREQCPAVNEDVRCILPLEHAGFHYSTRAPLSWSEDE